MSISGVGSNAAPLPLLQRTPAAQAKPGSDGNSAAVEAAETAATKSAERQNGGLAPATATPPTAGRVN